MMTPPSVLVDLFKPWNDLYSHSKVAVTIVTSLHIGGLLLAGGLAVAADRGTLRAIRLSSSRGAYLEELGSVHRWVLSGLAIVALSGLALLTADIETFWASWIFWLKMTLVALLLINGAAMVRAEQRLRTDHGEASPHWSALRRTAVTSLALWFLITVVGVTLVNFS